MKSCPKCSRVFSDDVLNFCLDDVEGLFVQNAIDELFTAILSNDLPSESNTQVEATAADPKPDPSTISSAPAMDRSSISALTTVRRCWPARLRPSSRPWYCRQATARRRYLDDGEFRITCTASDAR